METSQYLHNKTFFSISWPTEMERITRRLTDWPAREATRCALVSALAAGRRRPQAL